MRPSRDISPVELCRLALLGLTLLLILISYYPFTWDPPRTVHNDVTRSADGSLQFGEMNNARTSGTPAWVQSVRRSNTAQIRLEFDPRSLQENASVMMLASNFWTTDFAIEQDHSDLLVWMRRPGSDANGDPAFSIDGVIQPRRWNNVKMTLQPDVLRIAVDGSTRLTAHLQLDFTRVWGQGQIALGDEVHGGDPWQGKIRLAEVSTLGHLTNYISPGALSIPRTYFYLPDHIIPFPPMGVQGWVDVLFDMVTFIPVGFLIFWARRPPVPPVTATVLAAFLAVVLAAGKFLFHARHTAVIIIVMETFGALLGARLGTRLARGQRNGSWFDKRLGGARYEGADFVRK